MQETVAQHDMESLSTQTVSLRVQAYLFLLLVSSHRQHHPGL